MVMRARNMLHVRERLVDWGAQQSNSTGGTSYRDPETNGERSSATKKHSDGCSGSDDIIKRCSQGVQLQEENAIEKTAESITTRSTTTVDILKSQMSLSRQGKGEILDRAEQKRGMHILDLRKEKFANLVFLCDKNVICDVKFAEKAREPIQPVVV